MCREEYKRGGLKSEEYWIKDIYAAHFPNFLNFHKYLDLKTEFFYYILHYTGLRPVLAEYHFLLMHC